MHTYVYSSTDSRTRTSIQYEHTDAGSTKKVVSELIIFILFSRSHFLIGVLMLLRTLLVVIGQFWLQIELPVYYAGASRPQQCDMVCFPDFYNSVPGC